MLVLVTVSSKRHCTLLFLNFNDSKSDQTQAQLVISLWGCATLRQYLMRDIWERLTS